MDEFENFRGTILKDCKKSFYTNIPIILICFIIIITLDFNTRPPFNFIPTWSDYSPITKMVLIISSIILFKYIISVYKNIIIWKNIMNITKVDNIKKNKMKNIEKITNLFKNIKSTPFFNMTSFLSNVFAIFMIGGFPTITMVCYINSLMYMSMHTTEVSIYNFYLLSIGGGFIWLLIYILFFKSKYSNFYINPKLEKSLKELKMEIELFNK